MSLLINHDPLNVGGKFYDYVGGGKPILGAVHPGGETRRLLEELAGRMVGGHSAMSKAFASSSLMLRPAAIRCSASFIPT